MSTARLGVLVLSCDRYADLWPACFESFFRAWPDCPYPVYLASNERAFEHPRVTSLLSGPDRDWSSSVRRSVAQMPEDRVLFLYDDAFLTGRVDGEAVAHYLAWAEEHKANYLRMRGAPRPDKRVAENLGRIEPGSMYRTSLFQSLWRREVFLEVAKDGENPWQFELEGLKRADQYEGFYGVYRTVLSYVHGVERGKWFPWAITSLSLRGLPVQPGARPVMDAKETLRYLSHKPKGLLLELVPTRTWPVLLHWKQQVFGKRT